jgi:hypothetical protein
MRVTVSALFLHSVLVVTLFLLSVPSTAAATTGFFSRQQTSNVTPSSSINASPGLRTLEAYPAIHPERGKIYNIPSREQCYRVYKELQQDYHDKAHSDDNHWKTCGSGRYPSHVTTNVRSKLLRTCVQAVISGFWSSVVGTLLSALLIGIGPVPRCDPLYEGVSVRA